MMNFLLRIITRKPPNPVVRVIRLEGMIVSRTNSKSLCLNKIEKTIQKAFKKGKAPLKAVCLEVNSLGGSPAQSALIHERIRFMSATEKVPVVAFVEDYAASGGYMLATAAQEILVQNFSAVGSIGVVSASFGFVKTLDKLGIERRVAFAGKSKVRLDPFAPEKEEDLQWQQGVLQNIHEKFIKMMQDRRPRLSKENLEKLFDGSIYFGQEAVDLGLADGTYTDMVQILRQRYGDDLKVERVKAPEGLTERILGRFTQDNLTVEDVLDAVDYRCIESRFRS